MLGIAIGSGDSSFYLDPVGFAALIGARPEEVEQWTHDTLDRGIIRFETGQKPEPSRPLSEERDPQDRSVGYIYVLRAGEAYKIGKSRQIGARIHSHQSSTPHTLILVMQRKVHEYHATETALHKMFADKEIRTEWFRLTPNDLDAVRCFLDEVSAE